MPTHLYTYSVFLRVLKEVLFGLAPVPCMSSLHDVPTLTVSSVVVVVSLFLYKCVSATAYRKLVKVTYTLMKIMIILFSFSTHSCVIVFIHKHADMHNTLYTPQGSAAPQSFLSHSGYFHTHKHPCHPF